MIILKGKLMLAGCVLGAGLLCLPSAPASADSRGAVAAGIIGAVATGIILQQHLNANKPAPRAAKRAAPKATNDTASANAKDPFAGTGAPAGYATPVANNKPMQ